MDGLRCRDNDSERDCHQVGVIEPVASENMLALVLAVLMEALSNISSLRSVVTAENGDGEYADGLIARTEDSEIQS